MKSINIIHTLGAIGCIGGIVGTSGMGWQIWQWPAIAALWVLSSWMYALAMHRRESEIKSIHKENISLIEQLSKEQMKTWDAEMRLAKASKK